MMLSVRGLAFGHGRRTIGRDVAFDLAPGEAMALLGPNGGGKTTLIRTLLGLIAPLAGSVAWDGRPVAAMARREAATVFAYVPQAHGGLFPFSMIEMVLMGRTARLSPFAAPGRNDRAAAAAALATMGIGHLAESDYTRVSGGERQLALIARALAQDAPVLVMDEPTANLDFGNQARVMERVRALVDAGRTILLSTHDPNQALAVADRVAVLHDGRIDRIGAPAEVVTAETLGAVYGIAVEVAAFAGAGGARRIVLPAQPRDRTGPT